MYRQEIENEHAEKGKLEISWKDLIYLFNGYRELLAKCFIKITNYMYMYMCSSAIVLKEI